MSSQDTMSSQTVLLEKLLDTTVQDIIPLTRKGVEKGCKVFGAAILLKKDLSLVIAETNNEIVSPLLHGEINCIQEYWKLDPSTRPPPKDCIFYATHEPCSLCLSGITWSGFDNFYYLFSYENTRDAFAIPHDLKILKEVYQVPAEGESPEQLSSRPLYNRSNAFFVSHSISETIDCLSDEDAKQRLRGRISDISNLYAELSDTYQGSKGDKGIPLA